MYIPKLTIRVPDKVYTVISYSNPLLAISAFFLSGYLALLLWRPYAPADITAKKHTYSADALLKGLFFVPGESSAFDESAFKGKTLFSKTGAAEAVSPKKNSFTLLGVSLGDKKIAIIRDTFENKNYYCRQGDAIGIFKVSHISKDRVLLESPSETIELRQ